MNHQMLNQQAIKIMRVDYQFFFNWGMELLPVVAGELASVLAG